MGKAETECDCDVIHTDCVVIAQKSMINENVLFLMSDFYKALSDSTRIKIINALMGSDLCVCDLAVLLNMTKSAVSHQLRYLREMDLIKYKKVGKEVIYSLNDEHVKQIFSLTRKHMEECHHES